MLVAVVSDSQHFEVAAVGVELEVELEVLFEAVAVVMVVFAMVVEEEALEVVVLGLVLKEAFGWVDLG